MEIRRNITITISDNELLQLLVQALCPTEQQKDDVKEGVFFIALGHLVGRSDVKAVKKANYIAKATHKTSITVEEFRRWLPKILSEAFDKLQKGRNGY